MRAINGYLEDGRFTPSEVVMLPKRVPAILVFDDFVVDKSKEARLSWLEKFHNAVKQAADEEMPDFPRVSFNRELVNLADED
jgi:hypothetical protein